MEVLPEFFPHLRQWQVEHEGETLRANSLRELGGLLPPDITIGGYYPSGYTAVRDYDGLAAPRLVIEKRGLTIKKLHTGGKRRVEGMPKPNHEARVVKGGKVAPLEGAMPRPPLIANRERYYPHTRLHPSKLEPINHKPITPAELEYARMTFAAGAKYSQIAKELGRTRNSIASLVRRYGITRGN